MLGARRVRVTFYDGVAACYGLDRVEVDYRPEVVEITVFTGRVRSPGTDVCIEVAVLKATDVRLAEDLDGRRIIDGARRG